MANRARPTQNKRQRERNKQERRQMKLARREDAKARQKTDVQLAPAGEDPDLAGIKAGPQPLQDWQKAEEA